MLKKMLFAAGCIMIFDGSNGMCDDIKDPVLYQKKMLRNVADLVVSNLSSEIQKKIPKDLDVLMKAFFIVGETYIKQDEPDIYKAHFIERLLDKPYYIFDLSPKGAEYEIPRWDDLKEEEQDKIYEISHEYRDRLEEQMENVSERYSS